MKEFATVIAAMFLGALITFKHDKQSVHILEGKLHRLGLNLEQGRATYRKHLKRTSLLQFVFGMGVFASAIISWVREEKEWAIALGVIGMVLCGLGIWGRVKTFMAADAELKTLKGRP
jgi:hypothetical protein